MPEISRFYEIVIKMFFKDHAPPHFHAAYAGAKAQFRIEDLAVLKGSLPPRALGLVVEWASVHQPELKQAWQRARRHNAPGRIAPLP